jgi:hypothetical protein
MPLLQVGQQATDLSWQLSAWTNDDKQLRAVRASIERVNSIKELEGMVNRDAAHLAKNPDSKTLFHWTCATLRLSRLDWKHYRSVFMFRKEKEPYNLFPKFAPNDSFEFTRMRFLFVVQFEFPHHLMVPLGERLHKKNSDDSTISAALLSLYQPQAWPEDKLKGDALVRYLSSLPPERRFINAIAQYYFRCWIGTKSKADATQSISRLEKLLSTSKYEVQKALIKRQIDMIRKGTKWN